MIPRFANYWGLNDRFAIMRRRVAARYFTRFDRLDEYIDMKGMFHPETFLFWSMADMIVTRTDAVFDTVRQDGSRDLPFFNKEMGDVC